VSFCFLAFAIPAHAQQHPPEKATEAITVSSSPNPAEGYLWQNPETNWIGYKRPFRTEFYRYHAGDDTAWANPEFDDSDWEQNQFVEFAYHNRPRRGWLRGALEVDSTLWDVPLGISIEYVGAVEFYLDGRLLYQIGKLGAAIEDEQAHHCCSGGPDPRIITFARPKHVTGATSRYVFAIRYSSFALDLPVLSGWRPHLGFEIGGHDEMTARRDSVQKKGTRHQMFLVGVFLALAVTHFLLYWFYPKLRANLYFTIACVSAVLYTYFQLLEWFFISMPVTTYIWYNRFLYVVAAALYLSLLRFTYSVIYAKLPGFFIVIATLVAGLTIAGWLRPFLLGQYGEFFVIVICLEILRAIVFSRIKKRQLIYEESWIILIGMIFLMLGIMYQYLSEDSKLITPLWDGLDFPTPFYAALLLMLSMSIFLSRNFARTNRNLEVQLARVSAIEREVRRTRDVFRLFVPDAVLDRIAKQGLESIKLGGADEGFATILFTDIRSFTTIAEKLSPNETLAFLNEFMQRMEPVIHKNGGFINQFVGDEIMAIFHKSEHANAAIATAIDLRKALYEHNHERIERGEPAIDIGVGVNTGKVIWGTIGSEVRMESAIIGDTVNLASRLQNLTRHYGVGVLVSEAAFREISEPERFCYREVDVVQVRGKTQPVVIYEFFDSDPDPIKACKIACLSSYNRGLLYFHAEDWQQAMSLFNECLVIFPEDPISRFYLERCRERIANSASTAG
jgi:adenylate cyclase